MNYKPTVLVADTSTESDQVCAMLLSRGMAVARVPRNGQEILKSFEGSVPDAVLMYACMAGIDALGVLQEVQSMTLPKKPIILVMSPDCNGVVSSQMMKAGASYFFTMPFDCALLAQRVSQLAGYAEDRQRSAFPQPSPSDIEALVTTTFHQIGIPAHLKGYHFLREAVLLSIDDPDAVDMITKQIYPPLAKKYNASVSSVERSIRHAIEVAWSRGDVYTLASFFGPTMSRPAVAIPAVAKQGMASHREKPTNSEFIATISDRLRLQLAHLNNHIG